MDYTLEELIPLTAKLAEKFQSFESSSVTYETAQMLMEAVLYCIQVCDWKEEGSLPVTKKQLNAEQAYQRGYELVLHKAKEAKQVYEALIKELNTYGCANYSSTILQGIPSFFLYYDPIFQPQNHILTLDYPIIGRIERMKGINKIHAYLTGLQKEKQILSRFENDSIQCLLEDIMPDGRKYFMDNICEAVLFRAVCCVIADREVLRLAIEEQDYDMIRTYLEGDTIEKAQQKISAILHLILSKAANQKQRDLYFEQMGNDFAVRLKHMK